MPVPQATKAALSERKLLRDTVEKSIRDAIMDGTLQPGERLHDEELQTWLGVSRTPIRDALNELTRAGLVEMAANRYTRVAQPSEEDALEAIQTLGVLLGGVVRLAVPLIDDIVSQRIITELDQVLIHLDDDDVLSLNRTTLRMFNIYVEHCGNRMLIRVCHDTIDGLAYKLRIAHLNQVLDWDSLRHWYRELRTATIAKDPIAAELATEALHHLPGARPSH